MFLLCIIIAGKVCLVLISAAAPLAPQLAYFGEGVGPIVLDDLHCNGDERSLLECPHGGIREHNCGHVEDAGVICSSGKCSIVRDVRSCVSCQLSKNSKQNE